MRALNLVTLILVIVGGVNWLLVGAFQFDLVASVFGDGSILSRVVYVLVGLSALWQILPLLQAMRVGEVSAQSDRHGVR